MKRFFKQSLIGISFLALAASFGACSKDDDPTDEDFENAVLNAPSLAAHSALYEITSANSDYRSIELTESGHYLVMPNGGSYYRAARKYARPFRKAMRNMLTRANTYQIVEGKYTVNSDGSYNLEGFGTLTVNKNTDGSVNTLDIILQNGQSVNVTAKEKNQLAESEMTVSLCRTWNVKDVGIKLEMGKDVILDKTYTTKNIYSSTKDIYDAMLNFAKKHDFYDPDDWDDMDWDDMDDMDIEYGEMPTQVIFTKAGSYVCKYEDSSMAVSTWTWVNQDAGRLRYSWDYDDMYDDDMAGVVTVRFTSSGLSVIEVMLDEYDEDEEEDMFEMTPKLTYIWNFTEEK